MKTSEVMEEHVANFIRYLEGRGASAAVIHRVFATVRAGFSWGVKKKMIAVNPFSKPEGLPPKPEAKDRILFDEEWAHLNTHLDFVNKRIPKMSALAILFTLHTGWRRSEVAALRWQHFVADRVVVLPVTKSGVSKRWLSTAALDLAKAARADLVEQGRPQDMVFGGLKASTMLDHLRQLGLDPKVGLHMLRHTYSTLGFETTGSDHAVGLLLGHSKRTNNVTLGYTHLSDGFLLKTADAISEEINRRLIIKLGIPGQIVATSELTQNSRQPLLAFERNENAADLLKDSA